jgi:glycosyltransferase involved in cell wall biosynthesis
MSKFKFSVIIITRNRARFLPKALESLINQDYKNEKYEIIVVDNNSNDDTASIVERFKREFPNKIHYVFEPEIGMPKARNKGAAEAKGEILLFIDDDAIATPHWLKGYCSIYEIFPDIVAAGGRIELVFESDKPKWLSDELLTALGNFNFSNKETILLFPVYPFGGNFSVKRINFISTGGFIDDLKTSNEEKAFFFKLHLNKCRVGYSPKALVYHHIPSSRLRKRFFIKRGIKQGIGNVKFDSIFNRMKNPRFKDELNKFLFDGLLIIRNILFCRNKYSFAQIYYLCIRWGELFGIMMWRFKRHEYRSYSHTDEASQPSFRI